MQYKYLIIKEHCTSFVKINYRIRFKETAVLHVHMIMKKHVTKTAHTHCTVQREGKTRKKPT